MQPARPGFGAYDGMRGQKCRRWPRWRGQRRGGRDWGGNVCPPEPSELLGGADIGKEAINLAAQLFRLLAQLARGCQDMIRSGARVPGRLRHA